MNFSIIYGFICVIIKETSCNTSRQAVEMLDIPRVVTFAVAESAVVGRDSDLVFPVFLTPSRSVRREEEKAAEREVRHDRM
jgi:hypothetical protein